MTYETALRHFADSWGLAVMTSPVYRPLGRGLSGKGARPRMMKPPT